MSLIEYSLEETMKMKAIAAGVLMAAAAATASAQVYYGRSYYEPSYSYSNDARQECWNPRARHFEQVRPGEVQDDLDFSRCRVNGYNGRPAYTERYVYRSGGREECWNPRAGHFEERRAGEYQGDLDMSRCRIVY